MSDFDPVAVVLLNNEIGAIGEEMALTIQRTARSPMVRAGDFSATLLDVDGSVVGQGYAAPMQLSLFMMMMGFLVQPMFAARRLASNTSTFLVRANNMKTIFLWHGVHPVRWRTFRNHRSSRACRMLLRIRSLDLLRILTLHWIKLFYV